MGLMRRGELRKRLIEARVLLDFALEVYEMQVRGGRHFLHEHLASAGSWQEPRVQKMLQRPGVDTVVAHLCQYGLKAKDDMGQWKPAMKATRFASSSPEVLRLLSKKCPRRHEHQQLVNGRAKDAAVYPPALCRAILKGIDAQRRREGLAMPAGLAARV